MYTWRLSWIALQTACGHQLWAGAQPLLNLPAHPGGLDLARSPTGGRGLCLLEQEWWCVVGEGAAVHSTLWKDPKLLTDVVSVRSSSSLEPRGVWVPV
jgi:hypothetical protein